MSTPIDHPIIKTTSKLTVPFQISKMSGAPITYEIPFSQAFYHKGVDLSPESHAQGRMDQLRQTCINVAMLDPLVGAAQFGLVMGNGAGNAWTIQFTEKDYKLNVLFDVKKHPRFGAKSRSIGYILSVTVVQNNIPNNTEPGEPPRRILVSLA
jgi:hypothetical protein